MRLIALSRGVANLASEKLRREPDNLSSKTAERAKYALFQSDFVFNYLCWCRRHIEFLLPDDSKAHTGDADTFSMCEIVSAYLMAGLMCISIIGILPLIGIIKRVHEGEYALIERIDGAVKILGPGLYLVAPFMSA